MMNLHVTDLEMKNSLNEHSSEANWLGKPNLNSKNSKTLGFIPV